MVEGVDESKLDLIKEQLRFLLQRAKLRKSKKTVKQYLRYKERNADGEIIDDQEEDEESDYDPSEFEESDEEARKEQERKKNLSGPELRKII